MGSGFNASMARQAQYEHPSRTETVTPTATCGVANACNPCWPMCFVPAPIAVAKTCLQALVSFYYKSTTHLTTFPFVIHWLFSSAYSSEQGADTCSFNHTARTALAPTTADPTASRFLWCIFTSLPPIQCSHLQLAHGPAAMRH